MLQGLESSDLSSRLLAAFTRQSKGSVPAQKHDPEMSKEVTTLDIEEGPLATSMSTSISISAAPSVPTISSTSSPWWGTWMSSKPTERLCDSTIEEDSKVVADSSEMTSSDGNGFLGFLQWFNDPSLENARKDLKVLFTKEIQYLERIGSKINERSALKRSKNSKAVHDKLSKDRLLQQKSFRDILEKIKFEAESASRKYHSGLQKYLGALEEDLSNGKSNYLGNLQTVDIPKPLSLDSLPEISFDTSNTLRESYSTVFSFISCLK
jgi:hypothetical protein